MKQKHGSIKRQRGGVIINADPKKAFDDFMSNSTFQFVSHGAYGITFKATLNPGVPSPYTRLDYEGEVRQILLKFAPLYDSGLTLEQQKEIISKFGAVPGEVVPSSAPGGYDEIELPLTPRSKITTCEMQSFINEVNIQTDIFLKTMNYLQPICPAIVYSGIIINTSDEFQTLLDKMIAGSNVVGSRTRTRELLTGINKHRNNFQNLGLIAMEFANDCVLLYSMRSSMLKPQFEYYKNMAMYLLLKLAIDTGYTHGDFHPGNIFINQATTVYFSGMQGGPLLIDFGQARKIPNNRLQIIRDNYSAGNYVDALKQLCLINRADEVRMLDHKSFYGYVCGAYDYYDQRVIREFPNPANTNTQIGELIRAREAAIDAMIQSFEQKHAANPSIPLLPLSNKVKNSMYSGLISRGGKRKNKGKTRRRR